MWRGELAEPGKDGLLDLQPFGGGLNDKVGRGRHRGQVGAEFQPFMGAAGLFRVQFAGFHHFVRAFAQLGGGGVQMAQRHILHDGGVPGQGSCQRNLGPHGAGADNEDTRDGGTGLHGFSGS